MPTILIVDDEPSIRRTVREILEYEGYTVEEAEDGAAAIEAIRSMSLDLVLLDIKMPEIDGMDVLKTVADEAPETPVVMISGHGTIETAVEATKLGAFDFIEKPPDLNRLLVTVRNALDHGQLETQNRRMRQAISEQRTGSLTPIIGESPAITDIKETIERVAPTEARVLITGENGTGKELVAKWIHHRSPRANGPMVEVNCAAIPSELIESELFGHEKGAFTGATQQRIGKFEQAHEGTLFLDEIGDMSLSAQAKVLRVLQENRIQRVGGDRPIEVDVRVVAATNKDLLDEIEEGTFREDLYHRIGVILINVPPLRERRADVPRITKHIAEEVTTLNALPDREFTDDALDHLKRYDWRGNVRELRNVIERVLILADGERVEKSDVERFVTPGAEANASSPEGLLQHGDWNEARDAFEKRYLEYKLNEYDWNVTQTAEAINIQRSHLYNKLNKFNIERESA